MAMTQEELERMVGRMLTPSEEHAFATNPEGLAAELLHEGADFDGMEEVFPL